MPIHDWTRVYAGLFHDYHQTWSIYIKNALNAGLLPKGLSALVEQARSGNGAFDGAAAEAERLSTAGGAPQSEPWIAAQEACPERLLVRHRGKLRHQGDRGFRWQGGFPPSQRASSSQHCLAGSPFAFASRAFISRC